MLRRFSPFTWPTHVVKAITLAFFAIMLPVYIIIGLQPATAADFSDYPHLEINDINLDTPVEQLALTNDNKLAAPSQIAGSFSNAENKTLLIGHSTTVFQNLKQTTYGDKIIYNGSTYVVKNIETLPKSEIKMSKILKAEETPTIVLMTCAGEHIEGDDFSHRLIITATLEE